MLGQIFESEKPIPLYNELNDLLTRLRSTNHINQSISKHNKLKNVEFKTQETQFRFYKS